LGCRWLESAVEEVRRERVRGSWWCLTRLVEALARCCEEGSVDADECARLVESSNPSMAVVRNLSYVLRLSRSDPCRTVYSLRSYLAEARRRVVEESRGFLRGVVTSISFSSAVIDSIAGSGRVERVILLESRPGGEAIYAARRLRELGIDARVVPDTEMARAVEESDVVAIGCDAVDRGARVLNKVGSRPLAMVAKRLGRPVYVLCEAIKICLGSYTCRDLEAATTWSYSIGDEAVEVRVFECVDPEDLAMIVTDLGPLHPTPPNVEHAARTLLRKVVSHG